MSDNKNTNSTRPIGLFDFVPEADLPKSSFPIALLALNKIHGLGIKGIYKLASDFKDNLGNIFYFDRDELHNIFYSHSISNSQSLAENLIEQRFDLLNMAEREVRDLTARGIKILSPSELPKQMRGINGGPNWLFVEGHWGALLNLNTVAVVGTRNPTQDGLRNTRNVARSLSGYDITIVSGLAEGIDDEIHRSSMDRGLTNIAFLGHGINKVFPSSTALTRGRIISSNGAIATEYFPDDNFQKSYFVQRNRLQAMQAAVVIIVEAKSKSGTAHTLDFARLYNRPVIGIKNELIGIDKVIEDLGYPTINLSTAKGMRELDNNIKNKLGSNDRLTKPMQKILTLLESEIRIRSFSKRDLEMFYSQMLANAYVGMDKENND